MAVLGFDTSNYTTSIAFFDETVEKSYSLTELLKVPSGQLGLRQQEALFQHVKKLPELLEELKEKTDSSNLSGICVSTKPRETEDSYMPCFLAGESLARSLATVLSLPCYEVSHQQGHFAAALWSLNRLELLNEPFLAWHLSGGTTELLHVKPEGKLMRATCIGGTSDISAGQLIDRSGQLLGLDFPSGKAVDVHGFKAFEEGDNTLKPFAIKHKDLTFSLSGMENKVQKFFDEKETPEAICGFVLQSLCLVLDKVTKEARSQFGGELPVIFSGGVASSRCLRQHLKDGLFPEAKYATDNAMGVAVLGSILNNTQ